MKQSVRKSYVTRIETLGSCAKDPTVRGQFRTTVVFGTQISFALVDEAADDLEDLVKALFQREGWGEKLSERFIEKKLKQIITESLVDKTRASIAKSFDELVLEFEQYDREYSVYITLVGLSMSDPELELGRIRLLKMTPEKSDELLKELVRIFESTTASAETKGLVVTSVSDDVRNQISGQVCAVFSVVAEAERARERAEEETRKVIDLLLYAVPALYTRDHRVSPGLFGEVVRVPRTTLLFCRGHAAVDFQKSVIGPLSKMDLDSKNLKHMRQIGVFAMSDVLCASSQTDFEKALLRAIHWFADAQTQTQNENRLLSLVIALETMLTPKGSDPIRYRIAQGVAITLGSGLEDRKRIVKRIKNVYDQRSGVAHGGRKAIMDSELGELAVIVGSFIMEMIARKDEFRKKDDLLAWIEEQSLR